MDLDLVGFEDKNAQTGEETGIKLPYIVTIEESSQTILSIRRNFDQGDPMRKRKQYFVHFKFLPGLGFYGFGLIHMIGGLSRTATAALRQLLDAGTLSNLPAVLNNEALELETMHNRSNLENLEMWMHQEETSEIHYDASL